MKVSYLHGVCVKNDAISNAIRDEILWLVEQGHSVKLYTYRCDYPELPFQRVSELRDVAFDEHFQNSDLVAFHFGVFYPLFNVIPIAPRRAKKVVMFHNITPKSFLPASAHDLIDRSFAQMYNIAFADHVICDSHTNLQVLQNAGIQTPNTVLPLAVHLEGEAPEAKPSFTDGITRIAFVGRFVMSKGPDEVLSALHSVMHQWPQASFAVDMVGNLDFSDAAVVERIKVLLATMKSEFGDRFQAALHGNASDALKAQVLSDADIFVLPTRHEGFCVPILEAFSRGCCVVSYDNSNVPAVSGGLATLVETGDVNALAAALQARVEETRSDGWRAQGDAKEGYAKHRRLAAEHLKTFSPDLVKQRFLDCVETLTQGSR